MDSMLAQTATEFRDNMEQAEDLMAKALVVDWETDFVPCWLWYMVTHANFTLTPPPPLSLCTPHPPGHARHAHRPHYPLSRLLDGLIDSACVAVDGILAMPSSCTTCSPARQATLHKLAEGVGGFTKQDACVCRDRQRAETFAGAGEVATHRVREITSGTHDGVLEPSVKPV